MLQSLALLAPGASGAFRDRLKTGEDAVFEIGYDAADEKLDMAFLAINTLRGERICTVGTQLSTDSIGVLTGKGKLQCRLPSLPAGRRRIRGRRGPRRELPAQGARPRRLCAAIPGGSGRLLRHRTVAPPQPGLFRPALGMEAAGRGRRARNGRAVTLPPLAGLKRGRSASRDECSPWPPFRFEAVPRLSPHVRPIRFPSFRSSAGRFRAVDARSRVRARARVESDARRGAFPPGRRRRRRRAGPGAAQPGVPRRADERAPEAGVRARVPARDRGKAKPEDRSERSRGADRRGRAGANRHRHPDRGSPRILPSGRRRSPSRPRGRPAGNRRARPRRRAAAVRRGRRAAPRGPSGPARPRAGRERGVGGGGRRRGRASAAQRAARPSSRCVPDAHHAARRRRPRSAAGDRERGGLQRRARASSTAASKSSASRSTWRERCGYRTSSWTA